MTIQLKLISVRENSIRYSLLYIIQCSNISVFVRIFYIVASWPLSFRSCSLMFSLLNATIFHLNVFHSRVYEWVFYVRAYISQVFKREIQQWNIDFTLQPLIEWKKKLKRAHYTEHASRRRKLNTFTSINLNKKKTLPCSFSWVDA